MSDFAAERLPADQNGTRLSVCPRMGHVALRVIVAIQLLTIDNPEGSYNDMDRTRPSITPAENQTDTLAFPRRGCRQHVPVDDHITSSRRISKMDA